MDFIFDDEAEDVGSDIEAYCPKCKSDTAHTVITKYEEEVRRVQCSVCGDVHTFRKPRGEEADDNSPDQPAAAKKRLAAKKPSWQEAKDRAGNKGLATARPYSIRDTYDEGDVVTHPKFGVGFVTEITENKVEVTFEDERRVLIHNRPDLAAQMPAIAMIPAPREEKKKKGKKGKGAKAAKGAVAVETTPPAPVAVAPVAPAAAPAKGGKPGKGAKAAPTPVAQAPAKAAPAAAPAKGKAAGKPAAATKSAPVKATPAAAKAAPKKGAAKPVMKAAAKKPAAKPAAKKPAAKPAAKKPAAKKTGKK
jgi:hypothetical protein